VSPLTHYFTQQWTVLQIRDDLALTDVQSILPPPITWRTLRRLWNYPHKELLS